MRILLDTNVMLEIILRREEFETANHLLTALWAGKHQMLMTTGSFYSMLFTVDKYFKKVLGMTEPMRSNMVRSVMRQVLRIVDVAGQDRQALLNGINDLNFKDMEDSCQHEAALKAECDYLLTFNVKDYAGARMAVLSPQEFMGRIL